MAAVLAEPQPEAAEVLVPKVPSRAESAWACAAPAREAQVQPDRVEIAAPDSETAALGSPVAVLAWVAVLVPAAVLARVECDACGRRLRTRVVLAAQFAVHCPASAGCSKS